MLKSLIRLIIIIFLIYLLVLNPIPFVLFEDTFQNQNQSISQSQQIMSIRSGAFDPLQQRAKDRTKLGLSKESNSGGQAPKPEKDPFSDNSSSGKGVTYKSSPGSGAGGSGNYDVNLPKDVDPDKSISDPDFWNTMETLGDSEDESEPAEAPKPSPSTGKLTRKAIKEDYPTTKKKPISPVIFTDWEGENKIIKSKELRKTLYGHGYEAGVVPAEDLIPCPVQEDPDKFKRTTCAPITDEGLDKMRDKIIDLGTSTTPGMVKIELPMPYYDDQQAVGYLDMTTGDCAFFHQDGKYWTYKKYTKEQVKNVLPTCDSVKVARENPEPRPEL